ncbi:hypothetical protein TELCIR_24597 [Teladorsagia circumcincta]|uniref:Uncharacterized protein n=1 Tax=Teladorsagia circumcincta TaxID=45464 RepID=A0A2G9T830_TELCI|nr:hypothetical protein TELCIR_24597 [Teladorsagia circumcincta]
MVYPKKNSREDPPSSSRGWSRRASVRGRSTTYAHSSSRPPRPPTPAQPARGSSRPPVHSSQPQPSSSSSPFVDPQVRSSWADQMASKSSQAVPKSKKKDEQEAKGKAPVAAKTSEDVMKVEEEMDTSEVSKGNLSLVHDVDPGDWAPVTMVPTQPTQSRPAVTSGRSTEMDNEEKEETVRRREERMEAVVRFLEEYMDRRDRQVELEIERNGR